MTISASRLNFKVLKYMCAGLAYMFLCACDSIATYMALSDRDKILFLPQDKREIIFSEMEKHSDVATITAGDAPYPLIEGAELTLSGDLDAYFEQLHLSGLIVIHKGEIRLEKYAKGLSRDKSWSTFSIAKSVSSTLVGAAIKDGYIKSLDDLVTDYIPDLIGSAYDDVTIEQLLTMTSGVAWDENYSSPKSDVAKFIRHKPDAGLGSTVSYMRTLSRDVPAGSRFNYSTGETNLVGVLVGNAAGKTLSAYLSEKIWAPYGMETDAIWALDQDGKEIGGCCISARLRDYARFGQFMLGGAKIDGESIVPADWVEAATSSQQELGGNRGYGYLWWTYPNETYGAQGIFGQQIVISPNHDYLIVTLSNWPKALGSAQISADRAVMHRDIVDALFAGQ